MLRLTSLLLLSLVLRVHADWTITQKVEGGLNSSQMTLKIKGDQARLDLTPGVAVLTDLNTGDSTTLNNGARIYMKIPGTESAKLRESALGLKEGAGIETPKLTPANKKEKIGDYDCEVFTWNIGELKVTDWIATKYPNFAPLLAVLARFQNAGPAKAAQPLMPPLESFPGMVVKREMNHRNTITTTTLISAKEGPIDGKLFEIPADYKAQPALQLPTSTPAPATPAPAAK